MRKNLLFLICLFAVSSVYAQSAEDFFNRAANEYIYQNENIALNTIDLGLNSYPNDQSLQNLRDKILKDKQQQEQQQQNQDKQDQKQQQEEKQQEQNQEAKDQQQQNQDQQQSENDENAEKNDQSQEAKPEDTDEEGQEMDQPPMSRSEKLEQLDLTEEKARMILEALKNNEIQYIQQNKRKPSKRPDNNKPDW